jgi:hypothetical protein
MKSLISIIKETLSAQPAFAETPRAGERYAHSEFNLMEEVVGHDYCPSP